MHVTSEPFGEAWFLTGPTAIGKSEAGIELAERLNAEIVSMDSMILYRHLDIGTAKPSAEQQRRVRHHLIDVLDPWEECSLAKYRRLAADSCDRILSRGKKILFVGGTVLYLKAILRGIFKGPSADMEIRAKWQQDAEVKGVDYVHDALREVDPVSAGRLHPNDIRRVIRALEVFEKTGIPISAHQTQFSRFTDRKAEHYKVFCLTLPRELLNERINQRVEKQLVDGLISEVEGLRGLERPLSRGARQSLGCKEVLDFLDGKAELEEMVQLLKQRTRRLAKHQRTWFRSLGECQMVHLTGEEIPSEVAEQVILTAHNRRIQKVDEGMGRTDP